MERKIKVSALAHRRLREIYKHVQTNFNKDLAEEVIHKIFQSIQSLAEHPYLGRSSVLHPGTRELAVEGNVIFYTESSRLIEIITIRPRHKLK